ncbi:hypothetical protein ANTRET_LOCUS8387 [Anthophora retusa]
MEYFRSFLCAIGLLEPAKVDFISELPVEISQLILRKLDPESLLCAARVSRKWLDVCRSDGNLRRTARSYKQDTERRQREEFLGEASTEEKKIQVPRKLSNRRKLPRVILPLRYEAAVVFGRKKTSSGFANPDKVKPSLVLRPVKCMRV